MTAPDLRSLVERGTIHFMGVGGAGMCALAEAILRAGGRVTGCDLRPGEGGARLASLGAEIREGHDPAHLGGADPAGGSSDGASVAALVVSAAVPRDHPEIRAAEERGIPVMKRARALGGWVNRGEVVAVGGTHGKTSTTALTTEVLAAAGRDPTGFVGGRVAAWEGNLRAGSGELFVVEADEYDRSFHELEPTVAVVTNLEADHLDVYGSLEGVREAFRAFVGSVPERGRVVVCGDDPEASRLLPGVGTKGYAYGLNAGLQLRAVDVRTRAGESRFRVVEGGRDRGEARLRVPGLHHVRNALAAAAAARYLGAEWREIFDGLDRYRGVGRRFERLGERGGVRVVDDYAHHPTEVRATLGAARDAYPEARLVAVFQPHLFTRTRDFHREFGDALAAADQVWVTDVYPARESPIPGITGALVADAVRDAGRGAVRYHPELEGLAAAVEASLRPGDVCLTMGAGSVEAIGPAIVAALAERETGDAAPGAAARAGGGRNE